MLEVAAAGRYSIIRWIRNGVFLTRHSRRTAQLIHFYEVFIENTATTADLGLYEVICSPIVGSDQMVFEGIYFIVLQFGMVDRPAIPYLMHNAL